jgi:tetratricopeptide (TPR) repeat protein
MVFPMLRLAILVALLLPQLTAAQASARPDGPQQGLAPLLAEVDQLYARRDQPRALDEMATKLAEAEKAAPDDYGVLWRISRLDFWKADDPSLSSEEKSRLGKIAWDYGDRASAANAGRVEGWYYAAAGAGNYGLGIGVLTALRQGLEGKFKERLGKAESIDPGYEHGAIQTAWGRFWYELPWPKYSAEKSRKALEAALAKNPDNVRAHVYLSDLFAKEGDLPRAQAELQRALANPPGRYDAPEERRAQEIARHRMSALDKRRGRGSEGG